MSDEVLGDLAPTEVRVRFCPSPTGNLHVGGVRTALFNWAFARHYGGTLVLRVEDTDAERSTRESEQYLIDSLKWLGLDWDEGPEVGGPDGPYRQSERFDIYREVATKLLDGGYAYECYCTTAEVEERAKLRPKGAPSGYDGFCRDLSEDQRAAFLAEGRKPVLRMRIPDGEIAFDDLVRGPVSFSSEYVPDYVIVRANGHPLYTLVNPVDDALMRITHVLRGEDLLSSTPRQLIMYTALGAVGVTDGTVPRFGHLPFVMGEGNKKLSKRDPGGGLDEYRKAGYLPEGLLNYLALLGWAIADDRDVFSKEEMAQAFDIRRVNSSASRFDPKKALAINASHIRMLGHDELAAALVPYLAEAGLISDPPTDAEQQLLSATVPLINERINTLAEAVPMAGFLFVADDRIEYAEGAFKPADAETLAAAKAALSEVEFDHASIEMALRTALVDGLGLKPRNAFGPVRTAVTGSKISPPLFESLELLGRESALARIDRAIAVVPAE
ncbi:glutamate--tRNA ligase [Naumannella halotolerans]|uniref:glutamate--tRNA ligase n=1 Tax=Naumannella halotolerans TaxID=993414 RepID=UPI00370DAE1B